LDGSLLDGLKVIIHNTIMTINRLQTTFYHILIFGVILSRGVCDSGVGSSGEVCQTVQFRTGWNLYSFWFDPDSTTPENFFSELINDQADGSTLKLIYRWNNTATDEDPTSGAWKLFFNDAPANLAVDGLTSALLTDEDFGSLEKYTAYWLYLELPPGDDAISFATTGTLNASSLTFNRGWNLKGLPLPSSAITGSSAQVDFESLLRGSGGRIEEVYFLNSSSGTGFIPVETINTGIPSNPLFFAGSFVSGTGNWYFANEEFTLTPKLKTAFPPDTDFPPENLGGPPVGGDLDRNRIFEEAGVIENGDQVRDIVFRFQPTESLVEEVISLTISNRGELNEGGAPAPDENGQGVLVYSISWHPYRPDYQGIWDEVTTPPQSAFIPLDDFSEFPKDSPFRTWLKVLQPTETRVLRPDGRVDPVVVSRAESLSDSSILGFVSTDVAGLTLVADRLGLPINTKTSSIDTQGAPEPILNLSAHGELRISNNAGEVRRIRVRCEVPPLAGTFEGKAFITKINGIEADPPFSVDLSLSLFEDNNQRLRGVIDSERVLLYPRDVPLTGTKLTNSGSRYVFTGSFFIPAGDINRYPYDRYSPGSNEDIDDVDKGMDGSYDNENPFPYNIERSMAMFVFRQTDNFLSGQFTETLSGLTDRPLTLEGDFELLRLSYEARKRSELTWINQRREDFDPTGTSPNEEIRSTIQVNRPLRIDDVAVQLAVDHPRLEDLTIELEAPDLSRYQVFPINDFETTGSQNFDGESANLYESITSAATARPGTGVYQRERERQNTSLAELKGLVAGSATLYGTAILEGERTNIPSLIDSTQTSCLSLYSKLAGELCDSSNPTDEDAPSIIAIPSNERIVRISTEYLTQDSILLCPEVNPASIASSGDPLVAGSIVSVIVSAEPNPINSGGGDNDTSWLEDIDAYQLGLSYPPQLLEFLSVSSIPACDSVDSFDIQPDLDVREGQILLQARDRSDSNIFTGGVLFVARFRVLRVSEERNVTWSSPPLSLNTGASSPTFAELDINLKGTLRDLRVENINITHPNVGDLRLELVNPNDDSIVLMDREGGDGNNILGLTFDDTATNQILGAAAPFMGRFQPQEQTGFESLVSDYFDLAGKWSLKITNFGSITGKLNGFTLSFDSDLAPNSSVSLTAPPTLWTLILKDNEIGPTEPIPPPRLARWGLRIKSSGGTLSGIVQDEEEVGIANADVSLVGREIIPTRSTNADGTFEFQSEEFGIYTILASHPEYLPGSTSVLFF
jgi:subtilisin-like proprotein convertase family protein